MRHSTLGGYNKINKLVLTKPAGQFLKLNGPWWGGGGVFTDYITTQQNCFKLFCLVGQHACSLRTNLVNFYTCSVINQIFIRILPSFPQFLSVRAVILHKVPRCTDPEFFDWNPNICGS
jgi:hypothetical protein